MPITILNLSLIRRTLFFMFILWSFVSCQKEDDEAFKADFEYEFSDENHVVFANTSTGNYNSLVWNFGNGEKITTEDKNKSHEVFYPKSGEYNVDLNIYNDVGENNKIRKTISFETGATGWGNNELQNYTDGNNSEIVDGKLIITAKKVNDNKTAGSYTSSRMVTMDKYDFLYGRMEIRAKLPSGRGIWPAIWMLGSNITEVSWPACGEIDIMEYVGYQPNTVHSTVHTPSGYGASGNGTSSTLPTAEEEFHNYGIIWTEKFIKFYINDPDNIRFTYSPSIKNDDNWPFDKPQFFILNIAVGGNWGGARGIDNSIFPQKLEVDYVRVYTEVY